MEAVTTVIHPQSKSQRHIPGEAGLWAFIFGDMCVFALFFGVFVFYRGQSPDLFATSQATLNTHYGALNTILLLTSSWFVILAMNAARQSLRQPALLFFLLAFFCGAGFSVVKFLEYGEKIHAGFTLTTNDFYMYYYIFTGLHFVHVIIGMVLLLFVMVKINRAANLNDDMTFFEVGASYWHMVDVLWVILFPLIYLMR